MLPAWAVVTPARRAHIERVVELTRAWADAMSTPPAERERWLRAAWYHDALRDAGGSSELVHGPRTADRLAAEGERDRGLLDAIRYHSIGYAGWDDVGRMLYLADFLEPGRPFDRPERAALAARVPAERDVVLLEVARRRIERAKHEGWSLAPETVDFWNSLARA